ncbi:MAG TPA: DUF3566 domain-containing protein [Candidatus Nanoarchaeia archaeon]|nr:DUF3566 domain-containing protein [Candidatus Nanoarchaeia archaeon]
MYTRRARLERAGLDCGGLMKALQILLSVVVGVVVCVGFTTAWIIFAGRGVGEQVFNAILGVFGDLNDPLFVRSVGNVLMTLLLIALAFLVSGVAASKN